MAWDVEFTQEFERWWTDLEEAVQDAIDRLSTCWKREGLRYPFHIAPTFNGSKHGNMRELRVQVSGDPYRIFYASTRDGRRSCSLEAPRLATTGSMSG